MRELRLGLIPRLTGKTVGEKSARLRKLQTICLALSRRPGVSTNPTKLGESRDPPHLRTRDSPIRPNLAEIRDVHRNFGQTSLVAMLNLLHESIQNHRVYSAFTSRLSVRTCDPLRVKYEPCSRTTLITRESAPLSPRGKYFPADTALVNALRFSLLRNYARYTPRLFFFFFSTGADRRIL